MKPLTIIVNVAAATGLTMGRDLLKGDINFQPILSGFIGGTMLLMLALFATDLAVAFSVLLLVTSLLLNSSDVLVELDKR